MLAVFVKVFNETCGYYGKQGYVAQFERDLDHRGLYEEFKKAYEKTAGKSWEKGREEIILEKGNIAKAYSQVSGTQEDATKTSLMHTVMITNCPSRILPTRCIPLHQETEAWFPAEFLCG